MTQSKIRHIFVYGTLMARADDPVGGDERKMMRLMARYIGPAAIPGLMYDAGTCPAAVSVDGRIFRDAKVQGELWQLPANASVLMDALDRYEGCSRESVKPYRYIRTQRCIRLEVGRRVTAWIYVWNMPTDRMPKIDSGRWLSKPDKGTASNQRSAVKEDARGAAQPGH